MPAQRGQFVESHEVGETHISGVERTEICKLNQSRFRLVGHRDLKVRKFVKSKF
jgi:hypothetical protein